MKHEQAPFQAPGLADAGGQAAQLVQVLLLVEELAALPAPQARARLERAARIGEAYGRALPIDQRRFDLHAAETARWASAGLQALLALEERARPCRAAARALAEKLSRALLELEQIAGA